MASTEVYANLMRRINAGELIILDGGTGSELERRGAPMNAEAWCGPANIENNALLQEVHKSFIAVGAEIITTNTFASSRNMLSQAGLDDKVHEINAAAASAAVKAREASGNPNIAIAGCLSHMYPKNPDGAPGYISIPDAEAFAAAREMAEILKDGGCDFLLLEMMYDPIRMPAIFEAAAHSGLPVWAGFSARKADNGDILSMVPTEDILFRDILGILDDYDVDAVGIMHSNVSITGEVATILQDHFDGPVIAYPDSGYFAMPNWQFENIIPPNEFLAAAKGWRDQGVSVIGGCCGLGPDHISTLSALKG